VHLELHLAHAGLAAAIPDATAVPIHLTANDVTGETLADLGDLRIGLRIDRSDLHAGSVVPLLADDLIDVEGSADAAGKATGKDQALGKATFVSILGIERARAQALLLAEQAVRHLDAFDARAQALRDLAHWVVRRQN
jgi:hypothetical protein